MKLKILAFKNSLISKREFIKKVTVLTGTFLFSKIIIAIWSLKLVHFFHDDLKQYADFISVTTTFIIIMNAIETGIEYFLFQEIKKRPNEKDAYIYNSFLLRMTLSILAQIVFILYVKFSLNVSGLYVYIYMLAILLQGIATFPNGVLLANNDFSGIIYNGIITSTLYIILYIVLTLKIFQSDYIEIVIATINIILIVCNFIFLWMKLLKNSRFRIDFIHENISKKLIWRILKFNLFYIASSTLYLFFFRYNILFFQQIKNSTYVFYFNICFMLLFAIVDVIWTQLGRVYSNKMVDYDKGVFINMINKDIIRLTTFQFVIIISLIFFWKFLFNVFILTFNVQESLFLPAFKLTFLYLPFLLINFLYAIVYRVLLYFDKDFFLALSTVCLILVKIGFYKTFAQRVSLTSFVLIDYVIFSIFLSLLCYKSKLLLQKTKLIYFSSLICSILVALLQYKIFK